MSHPKVVASPAENIYQRFLDNLPDLVFILDGTGGFVSVHGDIFGVLGYASDQLQGMNIQNLSEPGPEPPPPIHPFVRQFADPACGTKTVNDFHLTARTRSGEIRYLELNGTGVYESSGKLASIHVIARDITLRQRLQARVDYLRHLNEQILNSMREGIVVLEVPELRILNVNRSFLSAARLQESRVVGRSTSEVYSEFGRPSLLMELPKLLQRTLATGKVSFREYLATDLNPNPMFLELILQPIGYSEKETRQVLVLLRDITRRKRLETDMRRRVQKLSSLNEVSESLESNIQQLEGLQRCVLVGATAGKGLGFNRAFILLANPGTGLLEGRLGIGPSDPAEAERIWKGLDRSPLSFADLLNSTGAADAGGESKVNRITGNLKVPLSDNGSILIHAMMERCLLHVVGGKVAADESLTVHPSLIALLESDTFVVVPLYTTEQAIGVIIADNFITRRQILYEDLEFLKILAHHASYALDNARLYRELELKVRDLEEAHRRLQENQQALIEAERLSTIGKMAASVAHEIRNPLVTVGGYARLLLKDLSPDDPRCEDLGIIASEVTRLEYLVNEVLGYARYAQSNPALGDLNQLVRDTLRTFDTTWAFHRVRIDLDLQEGMPPARMDSNQLKQVLINMLLNSAQAMPDGGRILVATRSADGILELIVADTGCGIPEHLREKVFTPFFTTKSSGTGLGLPIARQIITAHGGEIQFESADGKGATFRIALPAAEEGLTS